MKKNILAGIVLSAMVFLGCAEQPSMDPGHESGVVIQENIQVEAGERVMAEVSGELDQMFSGISSFKYPPRLSYSLWVDFGSCWVDAAVTYFNGFSWMTVAENEAGRIKKLPGVYLGQIAILPDKADSSLILAVGEHPPIKALVGIPQPGPTAIQFQVHDEPGSYYPLDVNVNVPDCVVRGPYTQLYYYTYTISFEVNAIGVEMPGGKAVISIGPEFSATSAIKPGTNAYAFSFLFQVSLADYQEKIKGDRLTTMLFYQDSDDTPELTYESHFIYR